MVISEMVFLSGFTIYTTCVAYSHKMVWTLLMKMLVYFFILVFISLWRVNYKKVFV
jgi:hypothetical protein